MCGTVSRSISGELGVCINCIRGRREGVLSLIQKAHMKSRRAFGLPETAPKDPGGLSCNLCMNECSIPVGAMGYCGLRKNEEGKITGVSPDEGKLSWYHDPLPTNCVGDWVCPGGTGAGYPRYAYCDGPERGYKNLAVFFHACTFNCLYCQNWHFRRQTFAPQTTPLEDLLSDVDSRTSCICYFGGDPTAQMPFSLKASRTAIERNRNRILRICWETNGSMHGNLLDEVMEIALESGGCVKFDLKAWDEDVHIALTGISNRRTLENFRRAGEKRGQRPSPPPLIASTLLVPGYVDEDEVKGIARYIVSIDPDIPYSLLAFHPHFFMSDMPLTSRAMAHRCVQAAREEGLNNIRIGNIHLLV